jgi:hypothetical protein
MRLTSLQSFQHMETQLYSQNSTQMLLLLEQDIMFGSLKKVHNKQRLLWKIIKRA